LQALRADKKSRAGQVRWVLPMRVGQVEIGAEVPETLVRRTVAQLAQFPAGAWSGS
jgi:3-dehydroquinate synthetase